MDEKYIARFWRKVNKGASCWEWTGATSHGYGSVGRFRQPGAWIASRVAWQITNGPIPDGLCVLHRCDNRRCVNPNHLFLGTKKDNTVDMLQKGRASGRPKTISDAGVVEIRSLRGQVPARELAARFGVHVNTITRIWRNERRRVHVAPCAMR